MSGAAGRFQGKAVAVTGAARGIGHNIARAFAREGARVALIDLNQEGGEAAAAALRGAGAEARFFAADLAVRGAAAGTVEEIARTLGRLDALVNNARSGRRTTLAEETEETWDETFAVTLKAAFFASQAAIRAMAPSGGAIVNIGSVAALRACHESPSYHAAKAGLCQLTRYLALAGGPQGVRANAVLPGFIVQDEHRSRYGADDNLAYRETAEFCHPLGDVGTSDDVAAAVLFLAGEESRFVNGEVLVVDGGLMAQDPSALLFRFARR